jgi:hypothetical protein
MLIAKKIIAIAVIGSLAFFLKADYNDYKYRFSYPSFSNYGTIGVINNPSARFLPEGTYGLTWSANDPYLKGSIVAYPFSWMEASYQYTDINNALYSDSPAFSGSQSFKDKSFDAKFKLINEGVYIPAVAVGFRDLAGTGIFSGEYIVASKMYKGFDLTLGMGFGTLSGGTGISNPFYELSDRFRSRSFEGGQGGEISINSFFGGEAALFAGLEYYLPFMQGARLKLEYDSINYRREGLLKIFDDVDSKYNFGFALPLSKSFTIKAAITRGNQFNFGFSYSGFMRDRNPVIPKNDPYVPVPFSKNVQNVTAKSEELLYKAALKYLGERQFYLQTAKIENSELAIGYAQSKYHNYAMASGRAIRTLDEIAPEYIDTFVLTNVNAKTDLYTIKISRESFRKYEQLKLTDSLLNDSEIYSDSEASKDHTFRPGINFPVFFYKFSPDLRYQIGGPDGFFFGDLALALHAETILRKNINIQFKARAGIYDNMGDLKLASDSVLPRVRTDVVKYLKSSKDANISRFQLNIFGNPRNSIYTKFSAGILEDMFVGFGGEVLYRPFASMFAVGAEVWRVQQRDYQMLFGLKDYETTTGHITGYLHHPGTGIQFKLSGGRYLAEDSGLTFDFSRMFDSGVQIGAWFSKTDISAEEFGEGSFDKGFYFNVRIDSFFTKYNRGYTGFGLRPLTRDGAAKLGPGYHLYGVTDQGSITNILKDWETIYD